MHAIRVQFLWVEGSCWPGQDVCMCEIDADCSGEGFDQCLGDWSCDQGACVVAPNTAVDCSGTVLGACKVAACKPETGECYAQAAEDGAAGDDGNLCTTDDVCGGGHSRHGKSLLLFVGNQVN